MSVNKMMQAYTKSDHQSVAESNDPVAIVALLFDELIRAMQDFVAQSHKDTGKKEVQSRQFSRSLTIIYALQSSLNFEEGGDIANNLNSLYDYLTQRLLKATSEKNVDYLREVSGLLSEIKDGWDSIPADMRDVAE